MSSQETQILWRKEHGKAAIDHPVRWRTSLLGCRIPHPEETAFLALARLGGHQNRKSDRQPGWLVLWRGWTKLQAMLDGYDVAEQIRCGKT